MGTNYYAVSKKPTYRSPIHIGKSSIGWKFLFHHVNSYENYFDGEELNTYEKWEELLKNNNVIIMNEYDEVIDVNDFLELVAKKQSCSDPEDFRYNENINGYRFLCGEFY